MISAPLRPGSLSSMPLPFRSLKTLPLMLPIRQGVAVGVSVAVFVGVLVGVSVGVSVGVLLGVGLGAIMLNGVLPLVLW